jgi:hypothetical protein
MKQSPSEEQVVKKLIFYGTQRFIIMLLLDPILSHMNPLLILVPYKNCLLCHGLHLHFGHVLSQQQYHTMTNCPPNFSPYLTGNTLHLYYKAQPVNAVWGNSRCLL